MAIAFVVIFGISLVLSLFLLFRRAFPWQLWQALFFL